MKVIQTKQNPYLYKSAQELNVNPKDVIGNGVKITTYSSVEEMKLDPDVCRLHNDRTLDNFKESGLESVVANLEQATKEFINKINEIEPKLFKGVDFKSPEFLTEAFEMLRKYNKTDDGALKFKEIIEKVKHNLIYDNVMNQNDLAGVTASIAKGEIRKANGLFSNFQLIDDNQIQQVIDGQPIKDVCFQLENEKHSYTKEFYNKLDVSRTDVKEYNSPELERSNELANQNNGVDFNK